MNYTMLFKNIESVNTYDTYVVIRFADGTSMVAPTEHTVSLTEFM